MYPSFKQLLNAQQYELENLEQLLFIGKGMSHMPTPVREFWTRALLNEEEIKWDSQEAQARVGGLNHLALRNVSQAIRSRLPDDTKIWPVGEENLLSYDEMQKQRDRESGGGLTFSWWWLWLVFILLRGVFTLGGCNDERSPPSIFIPANHDEMMRDFNRQEYLKDKVILPGAPTTVEEEKDVWKTLDELLLEQETPKKE